MDNSLSSTANLLYPTREKNLSDNATFLSKNSVNASELTKDDLTLIKKVLSYYIPWLTQNDNSYNFYIEIINYISSSGHINTDDVPTIRTALLFIKSKAHEQLSKCTCTTRDCAMLRNIYRGIYFDIEGVLKKL
jgi:hypothetical protein